jgi:hypothetical protein
MKRKTLSVFLCINLIFLMLCTNVLASEKGTTLNTLSDGIPTTVQNYAIAKLGLLLEPAKSNPIGFGFQKEEVTGFVLGNGFQLYNLKSDLLNDLSDESVLEQTNNYYFPLLYKDKVRGFLTVSVNKNGECSSTLNKSFADKFNNMIKGSNGNFIIINSDDEVLAVDKNGKYLLDDSMKKNKNKVEDVQKNNFIKNMSLKLKNQSSIGIANTVNAVNTVDILKRMTNSNVMSSGTGYFSKTLPVGVVMQVDSNGTRQPWCWAATVASITNYFKHKSLTCQNVHDAFPSCDGGVRDVADAYLAYKLRPIAYSTLGWAETIRNIDNNYPMHVYMAEGNLGHAMSLIGYCTDAWGGRAYTLIDPNFSSYVSVTAYDDNSNVSYSLAGHTFTWHGVQTFNYTSY